MFQQTDVNADTMKSVEIGYRYQYRSISVGIYHKGDKVTERTSR